MWAIADATAVCRTRPVAGSGSWAIRHSAVHTSAAVRCEPLGAGRDRRTQEIGQPGRGRAGVLDDGHRQRLARQPAGRKCTKRCSERPV